MRFGFIIGAGRSGTKFLRDTLGAHPSVAAIPYDLNFTWRHGNEKFPDDCLSPDQLTPEIESYIRRQLQKFGRKINTNAELVLEKTVSNSLRVPFCREIFPEAKFVFLIRDGKSVTESASRVWDQVPPLSYRLKKLFYAGFSEPSYLMWYLKNMYSGDSSAAIWGPRYMGVDTDIKKSSLEEVAAKQWRECVNAMTDSFESLPEESRLWIRYEDLVSSEEVIREVAEFLEIQNVSPVLENYRGNVRKGMNDKANRVFSGEKVPGLPNILNETLLRHDYASVTVD